MRTSPSPRWSRTRATEDFRFPVAQMTGMRSGLILLRHRHRLLSAVRMFGQGVDLELGGEPTAEAVARQHAGDRRAHEPRRVPREHLVGTRTPHAARPARVPDVLFLRELLTGETDLGRVDDDDEVARVDVRRIRWIRLAGEDRRDVGREPAEDLAVGIRDVPAARGARVL